LRARPTRRMQGTAREYHAIVGLVRKFYAFCRTRKDYAVLTHNSSATQSSKTDIATCARQCGRHGF